MTASTPPLGEVDVQAVTSRLRPHLNQGPLLCRLVENIDQGGETVPAAEFVEALFTGINTAQGGVGTFLHFSGTGIPLGENYRLDDLGSCAVVDVIAPGGRVLYRRPELVPTWETREPPQFSEGYEEVKDRYGL